MSEARSTAEKREPFPARIARTQRLGRPDGDQPAPQVFLQPAIHHPDAGRLRQVARVQVDQRCDDGRQAAPVLARVPPEVQRKRPPRIRRPQRSRLSGA